MKKIKYLSAAIPGSIPFITQVAAQSAEPVSWHAKSVEQALGYSTLFGLLGIVMVIVGFKAFDRIITRIDLETEIQKGNVAAAILSGAVIIGIAIIVAASMG